MSLYVPGKQYIFPFILLYSFLNSCSYNPSVFDVAQHGKIMPDTVHYERIYLKNESGTGLFGCFFKPNGNIRGTVFLLSGNSGDVALWYDVTSIMVKKGF